MKVYANLSDLELAEKFNEHDSDAFAELYQRYWTRLYIHAFKLLGEEERAQDIVQDVFTQLFSKAGKLNLDGSLSGYLYTAVRFAIIDHIRREKLKSTYYKYLLNRPTRTNDAEEHIRAKELAIKIEKEIAALPEKMRRVFVLSRKGFLNVQEIAACSNVSENTVKKQLSDALRILRTKMTSLFLLLLSILLFC